MKISAKYKVYKECGYYKANIKYIRSGVHYHIYQSFYNIYELYDDIPYIDSVIYLYNLQQLSEIVDKYGMEDIIRRMIINDVKEKMVTENNLSEVKLLENKILSKKWNSIEFEISPEKLEATASE